MILDLYFIRHALSQANEASLVTGDKDDNLSHTGIKQAEKLSEYLKCLNIPFNHYYVSDWKRAMQTAEIIFPEKKLISVKELGETDAGHVSNYKEKKFFKLYPEYINDYSAERKYPGGDSHLDLFRRVNGWLEKLLYIWNGADTVAIVAHNGSIAAMLHYFYKVALKTFPAFELQNGAVCYISIKSRANNHHPVLKILNASICY